MNRDNELTIHGTGVAIGGKGVVLTGKSGIGKSDMALRLIDRGAVLISDDAVILQKRANMLRVSAPENITGKIEVRHLGILDVPYVTAIDLFLKVELCDQPERFPFHKQIETIFDTKIASIAIAPKEASAPIKIEMALKQVLGTDFYQ